MALRSTLLLLVATTAVSAQPTAELDPTIATADPATRARAQALMFEGVKQLTAGAHEQALANFLEAYSQFPSPKILLDIASTLRDMGRLADAANTYQRYLLDPATGAEGVGEVKQRLLDLDAQLTILTIRVTPGGSDLSIDGGPFIPVGSSLLTRVRPGIHLVRIRRDGATSEVTVNGFEGETKEVAATLQVPAHAVDTDPVAPVGPVAPSPATQVPERVDGWLITGTQYAADDASGRERKLRVGWAGPEVRAYVPTYDISSDDDGPIARAPAPTITSGVIGVVRVDGEGRGFAGGLGFALAHRRFEADLMVLKSDQVGAYLGLRYRLLQGWLRPYVGAGMPAFAYEKLDTSTGFAFGVRGAAGVELMINGHLSVHADLGYEHFFVDEMATLIDANVFVPSVGVIGRL